MSQEAGTKASRGDRRREAILTAATEVFLEKGFDGATLDEIIRRAGGSRATLYAQFGDKQGLFAAIISALCERMLAPLHDPDEERRRLSSTLLAFGRRYLDVLMAPESIALYRVIIAASLHTPSLGARVFEAGPEPAANRLSAYFRREAEGGKLTIGDPDRAARIFLEMVKGDLHTRALFGAGAPPMAEEIDRSVRAAVEIFCRGAEAGNARPTRLDRAAPGGGAAPGSPRG
ncbi:MAG TPA: TetR/AcrR family transcriptional regulator [Afifellaceae bacterium]|nr:TetR/AcrR family transcriptional regulator [Afifellaceae bacterium]